MGAAMGGGGGGPRERSERRREPPSASLPKPLVTYAKPSETEVAGASREVDRARTVEKPKALSFEAADAPAMAKPLVASAGDSPKGDSQLSPTRSQVEWLQKQLSAAEVMEKLELDSPEWDVIEGFNLSKKATTLLANETLDMFKDETPAVGESDHALRSSPENLAQIQTSPVIQSADGHELANLYSFCVIDALRTTSSVRMWVDVLALFMLTGIQLVFAFGFYDASRVIAKVNSLDIGNLPTLDISLFYSNSLINGVPAINFLASVCSLFLLALVMKKDNESTMLTICPLEALFLPDDQDTHTYGPWCRSRFGLKSTAWAGHIVLCILLQVGWGIRALLLPVLGGLGSAQAFAGSDAAQDIVLNSVAIGFVYELDDMLYSRLLGLHKREQHESERPIACCPLNCVTFRSGRKIATRYAWLIFILDLTMPSYYYYKYSIGGPINWAYINYELARPYIMVRAALLAVGTSHLAISGRFHAAEHAVQQEKAKPESVRKRHRSLSTTHLVLGTIGITLGILTLAAANLTFVMATVLDRYLGGNIAPTQYPPTDACLRGWSDTVYGWGATIDGAYREIPCNLIHETSPEIYGVLQEILAREKVDKVFERAWSSEFVASDTISDAVAAAIEDANNENERDEDVATPPTPPAASPAPLAPPSCAETCMNGQWTVASDGVCDDGGLGAEYDICDEGTDCTDCGARG